MVPTYWPNMKGIGSRSLEHEQLDFWGQTGFAELHVRFRFFVLRRSPIRCQSAANPVGVARQSAANPLPIRFESLANPLPIRCQSGWSRSPIRCQSAANPVRVASPIRCQSAANPLPIRKTDGFRASPSREFSTVFVWIRNTQRATSNAQHATRNKQRATSDA